MLLAVSPLYTILFASLIVGGLLLFVFLMAELSSERVEYEETDDF